MTTLDQETAIAALRRVAKRSGLRDHLPVRVYREHHNPTKDPNWRSIQRLFEGSWSAATDAAGLLPPQQTAWTAKEIIAALKAFAADTPLEERYGAQYKAWQLEPERVDVYPPYSRLVRRPGPNDEEFGFAAWAKAAKIKLPDGRVRGLRYTDDELIAALRDAAKSVAPGRLTIGAYRQWALGHPDRPALQTLDLRWGEGWAEVLKRAGLE